ncbi:aminotransferase [Clostridium luticellarii]|jgi:adenosylmethionine-8-amino-7-oxononanoate aminotransferase|uniref:aminotransferase n=1 Tax=Clostridium luticellarii TaxID=1691940 RepID=UPI00235509A3|nr:aminotransferase [Clostridium luticellarii]MCI1945358.1 aminotransferase [Clostridium luticellarii]MCI1968677.1 aminotransferase [Clostridium luticellarii]MCI1996797.1 aminotransferase [Clostridium luticellarii]MCI2040407.1 aminotransferase [Clostridium luticellarii]
MKEESDRKNKSKLIEDDINYLWHGLTQYKKSKKYIPKIYTYGKGARIFDIDGKSYIDGVSGLWCVNIGYGQEKLSKAAYNQMNNLPYYPLTASHLPAIELSRKINKELGYKAKLHYSNSGSEANEVAFKIARQYQIQNNNQLRYKVISRYRAYHGNTLGTLSASAQEGRKFKYEPLLSGFIKIHPPYCYRCPHGKKYPNCNLECAEELLQVINYEGEDTIAAFIGEPIMSGGGVIVPPNEYWSRISEICRQKGVLLIFDEVVSGFGRTGKMFGFKHWNIEPDIITFAKGLTSGYLPLSATATKESIFDKFISDDDETSQLRHVNTFGGHPASCAVAIENINLINELNLVKEAEKKGEHFVDELKELSDMPIVGDIRYKGLFVGIELVKDKKLKIPLEEKYLGNLIKEAQEKGVIVGKNSTTIPNYSNVLILAPPLVIEKSELDTIAKVLKNLLEKLSDKLKKR